MKQVNNKNLFQSHVLRGMQLKNRIVMAPMTRSRAIGSIPNELMAQYYAQRATAGLIITEGTAPSPNGLGYARIPGIYSPEQIEGWRKVTSAVHEKGGKIVVQLMHVGRVAHSSNMPAGSEIVAPSPIAAHADMWTDSIGKQKMEMPREMTADDIVQVKREFVQAAINAVQAGFDGVELHAANGYLLEQFLNANTNSRKDEYGGSVENRVRLVIELAQLVADNIGKEKVGVRISPYNTFNDMGLYEEITATYRNLVAELQKLDILYVHLIDYAARASEEGMQLIQSLRKRFTHAIIFNGGYDRTRAEQALRDEDADLISFGSKFIANPDLPYKLEYNLPLTIPNVNAFYTPDEAGYTDYQLNDVGEAA